METILIPIDADTISALEDFVRAVDPPNDWEAHLPAIETLHETLEAQQRVCDD